MVYVALRFLVVEVVHVESKGGGHQTGEVGFFWLWFWIWGWRATGAVRSTITVVGAAIGGGITVDTTRERPVLLVWVGSTGI